MAYDGPFFMGPEGPMMPEFNLGPASQQKVSGLPEIEDVDDEDIEETLVERLWGLTEMFPEQLRNFSWSASTKSVSLISTVYGLSRTAMWVIASSAAIGILPIVFELELSQIAEQQKQQQRQIMLGPGSAPATPSMQHPGMMGLPPPAAKN